MQPLGLQRTFNDLYARPAKVVSSAPGRLEVLGNHTDYNAGLTLSCAVGLRCYAGLAPLDEPVIQLASTAFDSAPKSFDLTSSLQHAPKGHWTSYILGLVGALQERGHTVPSFALLIDSQVPRSAGVSSSAALQMATLVGLTRLMQLNLPPIELARVGQWAESNAVGAKTGLLDQLTSLCGRRDHLLQIDFDSLEHRTIAMPPGYALLAVDSGVKHDLTTGYNARRAACEAAAKAMGVPTLRQASTTMLEQHRHAIAAEAYDCAAHILGENQRVEQALAALACNDLPRLGQLMFDSHQSSRDLFRNSCPQLDRDVHFARQDPRCLGARLSGGGFGGISIHLIREDDAPGYRDALLGSTPQSPRRWSVICSIDDGARISRPS